MYGRLGLMALLSFVAMFVLMYAMVDTIDHALPSLNRAYMAGLMTAPMIVFELGLMGAMYRRRALNVALVAGSLVALVALWAAIRTQGGVGDVQFLKSMIPHHSGAILMCERASLADAEVKALCVQIVEAQEREIRQMSAILQRMGE